MIQKTISRVDRDPWPWHSQQLNLDKQLVPENDSPFSIFNFSMWLPSHSQSRENKDVTTGKNCTTSTQMIIKNVIMDWSYLEWYSLWKEEPWSLTRHIWEYGGLSLWFHLDWEAVSTKPVKEQQWLMDINRTEIEVTECSHQPWSPSWLVGWHG